MKFSEAFAKMKNGGKVKLPSWSGFWCWNEEKQTIMMHCKDSSVLDVRETDDTEYTMLHICSEDWIDADEHNCPLLGGMATFGFGEAIKYLKRGYKLTRAGWNGKGLFVVYQKAYPNGIPCNKQTAEAWGMKEGELFRCEPYLQINTVDGSHAMWVPSIRDCLAEDWKFVE